MKKRFLIVVLLLVFSLGIVSLVACSSNTPHIPEDFCVPNNIKYDGEKITWDKIGYADYYYVQINDDERKLTNTNEYSFKSKGQEIDVTIYCYVSKLGKEFSASEHFAPIVKYKNMNETLIVFDDYADNGYDTIRICQLFDVTSISEMRDSGYSVINFDVIITVSEKDEGKQKFCLVNSNGGPDISSGILWEQKFDNGGSSMQAGTATKTHTFSQQIDLGDLAYDVALMYGAFGDQNYPWTGNDWNKWYKKSVEVIMTLCE